MPLDYRLTGPDAPGSSSRCQSGGGGYGARQKALHDFLHICTHIESTAKLFQNKRAQAARLSKAYKLKGDEVKIRPKVDKVSLDSLENSEWPQGFWDAFSPDLDFEMPAPLSSEAKE